MGADWSLLLSVTISLVSCGTAYGILKTRVDTIEKNQARVEDEVTASRVLREDLAVMKNQLANIQLCLNTIARRVEVNHPLNPEN